MSEQFYNLMYMADFYKVSHKVQYPENVTRVSSTLVARGAKYNPNISTERFYWFGVKLFIEKLEAFQEWFFGLQYGQMLAVCKEYQEFLETRLGGNQSVAHWIDLYHLGKLPLTIHAQPERQYLPFQTPVAVVENTDDRFPWLTSFIETTMLANVWGVTTAANRAKHIRDTIESYMEGYSADELAAVDFMGHDFSYRGLIGDEAAVLTGCGHLSVFKGSDTIPAARAMERVYGEITGFSVPATEHSVMCAGGKESEAETYGRILDIYPEGIVSIVSDTWDYFKVLTETIPSMKDRIMARDGKVVIRPDSGDPVDIVCGESGKVYSYPDYEPLDGLWEYAQTRLRDGYIKEAGVVTLAFKLWGITYVGEATYQEVDGKVSLVLVENLRESVFTPEQKGTLELLDETFGHTLDSGGLKVLDSHIGIIYGDGMNQERIKQMLDRMVAKGYSPLNIVFGIGSFTYQHMTRDELGWAFKATAVEQDGKWVAIQKDPATDPGKKSLTGRQSTEGMELIFG